MSCKQGSTHHHACDCREEHFKDLESKLAEAQKEIAFLNVNTANWSAKYQTLEIERDEALKKLDVARGALVSISKNVCCDKCQEAAFWAKEALGRMGEKA